MKSPIPDPDDLKAWTTIWSRYPGQIISMSKAGAIRLEAGRMVVVRKDLKSLVKEIWSPEVTR